MRLREVWDREAANSQRQLGVNDREFLAHEYAGHLEAGRQRNIAAPRLHEAMTFVELDGAKRRFDLDCGSAPCPPDSLCHRE